jgi:hypothetical protein
VVDENEYTSTKKLRSSGAQHEREASECGPDSVVVFCQIVAEERRLVPVSTRNGARHLETYRRRE